MNKGRTLTDERDGDRDILTLIDERIRRIARQEIETYRSLSGASDVGCVKVTTAMKLLDMSEFRVRQLIREGKLKIIRPTQNTIRIPLSEIRRFQEGE